MGGEGQKKANWKTPQCSFPHGAYLLNCPYPWSLELALQMTQWQTSATRSVFRCFAGGPGELPDGDSLAFLTLCCLADLAAGGAGEAAAETMAAASEGCPFGGCRQGGIQGVATVGWNRTTTSRRSEPIYETTTVTCGPKQGDEYTKVMNRESKQAEAWFLDDQTQAYPPPCTK